MLNIRLLSVVVVATWTIGASAETTPAQRLDALAQRRGEIRTLHTKSRTVVREQYGSRQITMERWESHSPPQRYRVETDSISVSSDSKGQRTQHKTVTVFDGKTEWTSMQAEGVPLVLKGEPSQQDPYGELRKLMTTGKIKVEDAKVDGQACAVFTVEATMQDETIRASYWIAERHGVVIKSQTKYGDRQETEMTVEFVKPDDTIKDELLAFEPPKGATVLPVSNFDPNEQDAVRSPKEP